MNKQELIKTIRELAVDCSGPRPMIDKLITLDLVKQLDEPEKVTIPQYIADKIEYMKKYDYNILDAMLATERDDDDNDWFFTDDNMETFTLAWQYGYEVEKEKRYLVKVEGVSGYGRYLNKTLLSNEYFFASNNEIRNYRTKFTRKELEQANFGWVFDCPGIEIEEVE